MSSRVLFRRTLALSLLLAASTACSDDDNGNGPGPGTFTLGAPATAAVTVAAGTVTTVTIPVTATGNQSPGTLSADSVPAGFTVGFSPATVTSGVEQVTVVIRADAGIAAKTGTVKIIARATDMTDQVARITVTSTAAPSYTARGVEDTIRVLRGASGTYTINLTRLGFTDAVGVSIDALPAGVTATYPAATSGNQLVVTINAATTAAAVVTPLTVRLMSPTAGDRVITVPLKVIAPPNFLIAVAPATRSVLQGSTPTYTVTLTREGGFTGAVTVSATGLPAGVTVVPATTTGNSATVTLIVANDAPSVTNAPITITADAAGFAQKTAPVTLTIAPFAPSTLLTSGVAVAVPSGAADTETLYRIVVPAGADSLRVVLTGFSGDIDLLGQAGSPPRAYDIFQDAAATSAATEAYTRLNPPQGFYYILAYNYEASANGTLKVTVYKGGVATLRMVSLQAAPAPVKIAPEKLARFLGRQ